MKHKCIECGYLAVRKGDTRQLEEVQRDFSDKVVEAFMDVGTPGHGYHEITRLYDAPICFAREINLQSEYRIETITDTNRGITSGGNNINKVLTNERECDKFTKWQQGFTPKEHREMIDREWMQKHLEEREDKKDKEDKKWREDQENIRSRGEWLRYGFLGFMTLLASLVALFATGKI